MHERNPITSGRYASARAPDEAEDEARDEGTKATEEARGTKATEES